VAEAVQDDQGLLPRVPGGLHRGDVVVGIAEVIENGGLGVPVANVAEYLRRLLVAVNREIMLAQVLVGIAARVKNRGLAVAVARGLIPAHALVTDGQGSLELATQRATPGHSGQCVAHIGVVAGARKLQRLQRVIKCVLQESAGFVGD
jgi:hypothetical protein